LPLGLGIALFGLITYLLEFLAAPLVFGASVGLVYGLFTGIALVIIANRPEG
jgi:hypothetical protein